MFPDFLPSQINQLTDPKAIAFGQSIERIALATSLSQRPIFTTYICKGKGGTPIVLLHGFDSSVFCCHYLLLKMKHGQ